MTSPHSQSETATAGPSVSYPQPPTNSKSPPFGVLVGLYEKLCNERKADRRRKALAGWFNHWREEIGYDLYPALRLLLPQKDRERAVYGLKEKNLAKNYIKLIPLGTKDPDAVRLLNWKKPTERNKSAGDFPTVLYEVIGKRSSVVEGTMTIEELNNTLDELCKDIGKHDVQSKLLQRIYNKMTAEEQRWVARIILKDMNIMVKETTVFSVFHPDAHDLFNTCSDLKKVAWELWDPARRLNDEDKSIQLFRAFTPMLCKRPAPKIEISIKDMEGRTFIIEEKLDGERVQLHKRGNEYFYCSRKGKDYTYLYGSHVGIGSLTPYITDAFDERVEDIILDGEMLVWDPVAEKNLPFGTLKTAALDKSKKEFNPRPCFKVFDLLYLNGVTLAKKSLKFRKRNLRACVKEVKGRLEFITEFEGRTANDVRKRMEDVMEARGEGLILKHPSSEYVLNGRNKDWIKIKPEYMDNMGETVDVLVVGGNYGNGKRGGGVSTLICALRDDRTRVSGDEPKYSTFVRIGSGLTYADYIWIRQKPWKTFEKNNIPPWYEASKKSNEDKGDIYLEPEDSFILKVKAAEIVASEMYHIGFTMRFPRALGIRDDLGIEDCMTTTAILDNMKIERKRKMEEEYVVTKKKPKTATRKVSVMADYKGPNFKDVDVESDLFEGLKFVVASDPTSRTGEQDKHDLLKLIHINGGKYLQVATGTKPLLIVYGGSSIPYDLKLIIDRGIHDIIKPDWIYNCISNKIRLPLMKRYFVHAGKDRTSDAEYNMSDSEERYGDHLVLQESKNSLDENKDKQTQVLEDSNECADGPLSDWFRADADTSSPKNVQSYESQSDTDPESEEHEMTVDEEDNDGDDWFKILPQNPDGDKEDRYLMEMDENDDVAKAAVMGEDKNALQYDENQIFRHLCFYLDTPENAASLGMSFKPKNKEEIRASFTIAEKQIIANGGRVVALNDPKLTHIIIDRRDTSRRKELMKQTSLPKRRNLVITEFIGACLDEGTLLDEEGFLP